MNSVFSVIMSVYAKDKPEYFETAMLSVIDQTLKPNEIVVVKDGPIDWDVNSIVNKLCQKYKSKCKILSLEKNSGPGAARQYAAEHTANELIAIMDSDDISVPTRFEDQVNEFNQHPELDAIGGLIAEFTGDNPVLSEIKRVVPEMHKEIFEMGKYRNPMNNATVMFKKNSLLKVGGYKSIRGTEDHELFVRMMMGGQQFYNIQKILVKVRVGTDMYKRRGGVNFIKSDLSLLNTMYKTRYIKISQYIVNLVLRFILRAMPNTLRGIIYRKIFRVTGEA